ncbi:MAG: DUF1566 domain-containing protein [Bacteroidetes bacterium]|nr:MAG: DUF1566 domain-containing protein [Bacteroidota bacterium]
MKKLFTILAVALLAVSVFAQAPEKMTYQAVVRDADDNLITNHGVGMQISILQGSATGTAVFAERHFPTTNTNGLVTLEIGDGAHVSGNFADIDWANGPYFIKTETDLHGGANYTITGTSPLLSVPYALYAKNVKTFQVGDFAHGGIVFYLEPCGTKGLVAAKNDQSTGVRWFAGSIGNTQAKGDGPYAGKANTSIIIASQVAIGDDNNTYAARICNELQVTEDAITYGDWYLPSKEELNLMWENKAVIDSTAIANGGSSFGSNYYWSSTETNAFRAWGQLFSTGSQVFSEKDETDRVRAIRAF